jgi:citrate synthase
MSNADTEVIRPGLEGVVAFETQIAEPDREGGALRYRGVDIEELVGHVPFEQVWGLLVDESLEPGLPASDCELPVRTGGYMSDLQAALAIFSGEWGLKQLIDIDDRQARDDLARLSAAALSVVAQSARGEKTPVPEDEVMRGETAAERFLLAWRGEVDDRHAKAIDTYWICTAEHGLNASTFTARIVASTAADCGMVLASAVGALSGPLHGGAPARVLPMLDAVAELGDADKWVRDALGRGERIMGFGHRVYRAEDPRSRVLKRTAKELGSPRMEVAEELERVAHEAIAERHPGHSYTNVEFWSSVVLDVAEIPPSLAPAMFACSRTAGWSAHVLEQKRTGRLIRPSAKYVGPGERPLSSLDGR